MQRKNLIEDYFRNKTLGLGKRTDLKLTGEERLQGIRDYIDASSPGEITQSQK